jgi:hypothetical protein
VTEQPTTALPQVVDHDTWHTALDDLHVREIRWPLAMRVGRLK